MSLIDKVEYELTHQLLVKVMREALGADEEKIEKFKQDGDYAGLDEYLDELIKKRINE